MSIGTSKATIGIVVTVVGLGAVVPAAYWFVCGAIDRAAGWGPVMGVPLSQILAAASFLIGVFWVTWAYSYLVFVGKGLPLEIFGRALHPTRVLVTTGPYAYTRNPMLLGILFILTGVAFFRASISGLIMVPIVAALLYVYFAEFEEKALVRRFGEPYERYRRSVPALIPRLNPYVHEPVAQ